MVTELGARNMVLVPPCDVSWHTNWVEVIDLLFTDQYNLLLVCMYKKLFPAVHFRSFIAFFINTMVSSIFLYLYILFSPCRLYAKFGLFVFIYCLCSWYLFPEIFQSCLYINSYMFCIQFIYATSFLYIMW